METEKQVPHRAFGPVRNDRRLWSGDEGVMAKRKAKIIKDPKVRGEWVESVFMARAGEQGLEWHGAGRG